MEDSYLLMVLIVSYCHTLSLVVRVSCLLARAPSITFFFVQTCWYALVGNWVLEALHRNELQSHHNALFSWSWNVRKLLVLMNRSWKFGSLGISPIDMYKPTVTNIPSGRLLFSALRLSNNYQLKILIYQEAVSNHVYIYLLFATHILEYIVLTKKFQV